MLALPFAGALEGQEQDDLFQQRPELPAAGVLVPHERELVLDQRVMDDFQRRIGLLSPSALIVLLRGGVRALRRGVAPARQTLPATLFGGENEIRSEPTDWLTRSGEVVGAVWTEIDRDERVWAIAARRKKAMREHRVPLC